MSHKRNKRYIVYTLVSRYNAKVGEPKFMWAECKYTKHALMIRIASSIIRGESILDHLTTDLTDMSVEYESLDSNGNRFLTRKYIKKYIITSVTGMNISKESLAKDVKPFVTYCRKKRERKTKYWNYNRKTGTAYTFRCDPVPNVHKCHWGSYYRLPKLHQVRKQNSVMEEDYKEFNSTKYGYKNLPTWDDRVRCINRSWKSSYKVRKQWQKHVRKHVYADKITLFIDSFEESIA